MVDNLNRKLTLIIGALAVAVIALLFLPMRLGLDLKGGTRLVYSVDLDKARADGLIPANQSNSEAIGDIIEVWTKRVDPQGVRGVKMRKEGDESIVIELPKSAAIAATQATATLDRGLRSGRVDVDGPRRELRRTTSRRRVAGSRRATRRCATRNRSAASSLA